MGRNKMSQKENKHNGKRLLTEQSSNLPKVARQNANGNTNSKKGKKK